MSSVLLFFVFLFSCYSEPAADDDNSTDESQSPSFVDNVPGTVPGADTEENSSDSIDTGPSPVTWTDCDQWVGSHPCDFTLKDQNQNDWNLYDHYGTVILIDFSTMWCSVCKSVASDIEMFQEQYTAAGHNFLWVTVLIEDSQRGEVDPADVTAWVNEYSVTSSVVLASSRDMIDLSGKDGYPITSWPTFVLIDDEMVLTHGLNGWNESVVLGWIDDAFGI